MTEDQSDNVQGHRKEPLPRVGQLPSSEDVIRQRFEKLKEDSTSEEKSFLAIFEKAILKNGQDSRPCGQYKGERSASAAVAADPRDQGRPRPESQSRTSLTKNTTTVVSFADKTEANPPDPLAAAATEIDRLCPNSGISPDEPEWFLTKLWWMVISIARAIPYNHEGQDRLVGIIKNLQLRARSTVRLWGAERRLWRDLPLFPSYLREDWIRPDELTDDSNDDEESASQWVNFNAFVARIMSKGVFHWPICALLEIRHALEKEYPETGLTRQYTLRVASQWILLCGRPLFKDAFRGDVLDEAELRMTAPGPLYTTTGAKPGLNMDRWRFWLKRLEELGSKSEDGKEEVCFEAKRASQYMKEILEQDGKAIARPLGTDEDDRNVMPKSAGLAFKDSEGSE